jgi:hypothetical protein
VRPQKSIHLCRPRESHLGDEHHPPQILLVLISKISPHSALLKIQ